MPRAIQNAECISGSQNAKCTVRTIGISTDITEFCSCLIKAYVDVQYNNYCYDKNELWTNFSEQLNQWGKSNNRQEKITQLSDL